MPTAFQLYTIFINFRSENKDEKRIVIATDKFKPENIIVGQNYIAAENKSKAIEWLNIVRTALIFVDDNVDDLKKDLTDIKEEKEGSDQHA